MQLAPFFGLSSHRQPCAPACPYSDTHRNPLSLEDTMKQLIKTAACTAALLAAHFASAADLTIQVDDVKAASGNVMVALYSSEGSFLKKPDGATGIPAVAGSTMVVFKDLPEGTYSFAVFHDANANGKMDKNLVGIPTEDYAFSNNAMGKMGPPSFGDAKFALPAAGATVRVSLK
jgi:uncharacterized protein (DUF2141 family)